MKGYSVIWAKGRKTRLLSDVSVFGTKSEALKFRKKTFDINPNLKAQLKKMKLKLKIGRI